MSAEAVLPTDDLHTRVAALAPAFRERAAGTEIDRQVPRASIDELLGEGIAALLVPAEHGGADGELETWFDASVEISRACPSTGWCASLLMHLPHMFAMWPAAAQEDIWSAGPNVPLAISVMPAAAARPVNGGYRVNGASPFTSGIAHSERVAVGAMAPTDDGPEVLWLILPEGAHRVDDVWQTVGMRGTGSNLVITDDVFVPESHAVRMADVREGTAPGGRANADPKYRLPFVSYSGLFVTSVMLGAAEGAFEWFLNWMVDRRTPMGGRVAEAPATQMEAARVAAKLETSELIQRRILAATRDPQVAQLGPRARVMSDITFAADLIVDAIDDLVGMSGTTAFGVDNPIQRAWRDIHMARAHVSINQHMNLGHRGRMLLGVPLDPAPFVH